MITTLNSDDRLVEEMRGIDGWTDKETTRAEVETTILDHIYKNLPSDGYSETEKSGVAKTMFNHIWQLSEAGRLKFSDGA